jgi:putative tryptophan/tyrosine transport system substrate-binding protein
MKTKKSFMLIMMTIVLAIFAGCGAKTSTEGGQASSTPAPGTAATKAPESTKAPEAAKKVKIGISQIVEHPSLDEARKGFIAALKDNGYIEGENLEIDYKNAQNDMPAQVTIAQKFVADKKDLILGIATPTAQAMAQATQTSSDGKNIPVLFTAVTDALSAKLVASNEKPGANVTGTVDMHPEAVLKLMEFISKNVPDVKKVGILYSPSEANSVVNVKMAKDNLTKLGIEVVEAAATNSNEVQTAAQQLVGKVQAIYVPSDNTVVGALDTVIQVAEKNKLPLFVPEKDSVKKGGAVSYGFEYFDLGYATGKMAVDILKNGKKPADIPVGYAEKVGLAINLKAAEKQGLKITDEMKAEAKANNYLFE